MEGLRQIGIGLCSPVLTTSPFPRKQAKLLLTTTTCSASKWAQRLIGDFEFLSTTNDHSLSSTATLSPPLPPPNTVSPTDRNVSIPIDFYQVLGAETHFLGDGIKRAYEARASKQPQYGFSQDALISRRRILQAACETLVDPQSRREYNQGLRDDEGETILTQVPWDKVPGALCVLQEAGHSEVVLSIGWKLLRERLPKGFKQDVLLAMALAYVDMSRDAMAINPPDYIKGCELLETALKLLQEEGASGLATDLQAQIDETLEEITPRCVLELLALPLGDEFRTKRDEGLRGARNILWTVGGGGAVAIAGGFTRETFMNESFLRMTAAEQVDLFAATPTNIPAENFEVYWVALARVAQAFVGKKPNLIQDADNLFQQLQQSKIISIDGYFSYSEDNADTAFTLERSLCSLLVGKLDECRSWLGLDSEKSPYRNSSIINFVFENSNDDETNDLPGLCKLLETWLMEVVFPRCRDTEYIQFKLGDYYDDPTVLKYLERLEGVGGSPLAAAAAIVKIGAKATIQTLKKVLPVGYSDKFAVNDFASSTVDDASIGKPDHDGLSGVTEILGNNSSKETSDEETMTDKIKDASVKIMCAGVAIGLITLVGLKYLPVRKGSFIPRRASGLATTSDIGVNIDAETKENERSGEELPRMDAQFAERIVREWQEIKSQAFGSNHCVGKLSEVLDDQILKAWTDRAVEIERLGLILDHNLVNLSIDSVTVSEDGRHAVVEATIEESTQLTDVSNPENNASNTNIYTTRYEMSGSGSVWKITKAQLLKS